MTDYNPQLQAFFLYCQAVETAYHDWKQYWINFYMNHQDTTKDLYDARTYNIDTWFENLKQINRNLTLQ